MSKYEVVLWDFDGTLAYTSADVWTSLIYAAGQCNGALPVAYMEDDSNLGKSVKEIFREITPYPGDEMFEKYDNLVTVHYRKMNEFKKTYLYPGICELLGRLNEKGVVNYIITMKPQEALERILRNKDWERLFDGWISPDSVSEDNLQSKGEMIAHIIEQIGCEKEDCVYIGDTWSDAAASHENGIDCIAVLYGDGDREKLTAQNPRYCVADVSGICEILEEGV